MVMLRSSATNDSMTWGDRVENFGWMDVGGLNSRVTCLCRPQAFVMGGGDHVD
jgi:hypothetical protein